MTGRLLLGAVGVAVAAYGGWLLVTRNGPVALGSALRWLVAGVLVHDVLVSLAVLALLALGGRLLPAPARAPAAVGLVVLGSVTLLAVPVLGAFGRASDPANQTLLDRDYWTGWSLLAGATVLLVVAAAVTRARRVRSGVPHTGRTDSPDQGEE